MSFRVLIIVVAPRPVRLDGGAPLDGFGDSDINSSFEMERNFIGVGFPFFPLTISYTSADIGIFLVFLYPAVGGFGGVAIVATEPFCDGMASEAIWPTSLTCAVETRLGLCIP